MHSSTIAPERPGPSAAPPAPAPGANRPQRRRDRSPLGRALLALSGGIAALLAVALLIAGAALLWAAGEEDDRGFVSAGAHAVSTPSSAVTTEDIDLDLDGAGAVVETGGLGTLRVQAESASARPIFVGVARTALVDDYLRDVARATVTDLDLRPLDAELREEPGTRRAASPVGRSIWRASVAGQGLQTLEWGVEDGTWSVVVMNADGSPGVRADVRAAARVPHLATYGWVALGGGLLVAAGAAVLVVLALRSPRPPAPRPAVPSPVAQPAG